MYVTGKKSEFHFHFSAGGRAHGNVKVQFFSDYTLVYKVFSSNGKKKKRERNIKTFLKTESLS